MTVDRNKSIPGESLLIETTAGPILGFEDRYAFQNSSEGTKNGSVDEATFYPVKKWLGVPYAQARRWERPKKPTKWTSPLECYQYGPHFPQGFDPFFSLYNGKANYVPRAEATKNEESGFNLNVFVPGNNSSDEQLPVLVWFHGGALQIGGSSLMLFDPTAWIRRDAESGMRAVIITANYRLGVLGFLASPDLADEDEDGLAGNYGLYDCIEVLEWVQTNIRKFGGDPDNVTIFGESAGGFIAACLLATQKKLFRRVILQSGSPESLPCRRLDDKISAPVYESLVKEYCSPEMSRVERLAKLRELPANELVDYLTTHKYLVDNYGLTIENPDSQNAIWKKPTIDILRDGCWNPFLDSIMVGTTKNEGVMLAHALGVSEEAFYNRLLKNYSPKTSWESLIHLYSPAKENSEKSQNGLVHEIVVKDLLTKFISHRFFECPMEHFAQVMSRTKHSQTNKRCSLYVFRMDGIIDAMEREFGWGAFHTVDVPLLFNIHSLWNSEPHCPEALLSARMGKCWYSFAKYGCPDPKWPEYEKDSSPIRFLFGAKKDPEHFLQNLDSRSEEEKRPIQYFVDELDEENYKS